MSNSILNKLPARRLGQIALLSAALVAALRIAQLADRPPDSPAEAPQAHGSLGLSLPKSAVGPAAISNPPAADAELAQLYAHCPMAAVVDLKTVATNPEQVDAILPPYRPTAERVPNPAIDPDIPHIRYPVRLRPPADASTGAVTPAPKIAQLPKRDREVPSHSGATTAETTNPADEWLIDPKEWFITGEQPRRENPQAEKSTATPTVAAPTSAAPTTAAPAISPRRPSGRLRGPSPISGTWKLLTPEDLIEAATQNSLTPDSPGAVSQPVESIQEPAPSQRPDAPTPTLSPESETEQPAAEALPPVEEPGTSANEEPTPEVLSAPNVDIPPTADVVGSDAGAAFLEAETPIEEASTSDAPADSSSTGDAPTTDAPETTPSVTSPVTDELPLPPSAFDPPSLPGVEPPVEQLPAPADPQTPSAVTDETPTEPIAQPADDQPMNPPAESPAPLPPFAAPPQLDTRELQTPSETISPGEPLPSPAGESMPADPTGSLFDPPADSHLPAVNPQHPAGVSPLAMPSGADKNVDPHLDLFARNAYPSARECATCHEDIYHEWSVSAHAYAAVSPMFHKFEQKLNDLTQGTVGYFCMRCHAPVATALCASRTEPLWNLPEVAREGITCIACHRVQYVYGKSNGERRIEPGNVFAPVMGGIGGDGVAETIHRKEHFKVKTSPEEHGPGQNMHVAGIYFEPLTRSEFCTPCHQVAVHPGIKLEVVWEQYRASPACKKGIQCQDCHMGRVPGLPLGYNVGPVAKVADKTVHDGRKKSNHIFHGPNYSIAHPGVFPFHLKANRWAIDQWLLFDWRAGWGTEEFENRVADGAIQINFPPVWAEADDRYDAREIIDDNFKKLAYKRDVRRAVMENGSHVDGPFFDSTLCRGQDVEFHYLITNTNEGHNLLTASLGAQPQLWANVVLMGPDGRRLWESGYTDSHGDLANIHSTDVRHGRAPYDWQLFNLQTMFLITGAKGTDREFYVPVNIDIDQLPFIRPGAQPISTINHPPFIRMESQSLAPLGSRRVPYRIPGHLVQQPGVYRLSFRMRSRAEPIYFMQFCGATEEMQRSMNEWMIDVHPMSVEFVIR